MQITETFALDAPPERVYAFLTDVEQVAACVPGVEGVRQADDGSWHADLKAQLGPIKAAFSGEVVLTALPPARLEAAGKGQDRASGSRAEVRFEADLTPLDDGRRTQVATIADVTIRGRLGQFGTGVIRATATELIREFVGCADARLAAPRAAAGAPTAPATAPAAPPALAGGGGLATAKLLLRILLRTLTDAIGRLRRWVAARRDG